MLYAVEKKGKVQIRVGVQFVVISHPDKDDVWQFNMPNTGLPPIYRVSAGCWVVETREGGIVITLSPPALS